MKYLIGMDGGGTKTKCILTDLNLQPIYETIGGPSNFLVIGTETVSETILNLINDCTSSQDILSDDIQAIVLGTTGGGRRNDAELLEKQIFNQAKQNNIAINKFRVESDARIALEGAFTGKAGSILIAGTGSIMFGKDEEGKIHRVGGFGRYIGDEGSGYRIGRKGLNAVARAYDGRAKYTKIADLLEQEFSISSAEELITEVYRNNFNIASVAPLVFDAAESGDKIAQRILENEANELLLHISAMKEKLKVQILKVSLIGSLLTTPNYFSYLFNEMVVRKFNDIQIKEAEHSPEYGAALMAKNLSK
ncbi:MAG TPA: BadF/BadG/BcrA/BcrD ATPase family protein [Ignavibacteriaceae bacterium]|nr:BadF/BadG/BcrA/BcrD ATPase family protein [Ignavibacteriaceae bacterium]